MREFSKKELRKGRKRPLRMTWRRLRYGARHGCRV